MKAVELKIHNFRSLCDATISLSSCTLLVGTNNSGKSTVIDSIRAFYGKNYKYEENRDFPKHGSTDNESWVEIEYKPTDEEYALLKDEYKASNQTFRVRNYFKSEEKDKEGKSKSGPYAYINGALSDDRFYGFKNVGQAKFGDIIYIPAASKIDEHTKLTGPSALRDLLNTVLTSVLDQSKAYQDLNQAFVKFEGEIKAETTPDGASIQSIENDISAELDRWGVSFKLNINSVPAEDVVKGLIGHEIYDKALNVNQPVSAYGQGFQRNLIYTLIRIAAKYSNTKKPNAKKDFSPDLTWILFEEPEAFLHPSQISELSTDLRALGDADFSQSLLSTHSPQFATHNTSEIPTICRLQKNGCDSQVHQVSDSDLQNILTTNNADAQAWKSAGMTFDADDLLIDMEGIKYSMWLDSKRCGAFFSERVLLVEGPTETALIAYVYDQGLLPELNNIYTIDTIGKYNIHRFIRLFELFGIKHGVLYDNDGGKHQPVVNSINSSANSYTAVIDTFPNDLEGFLGIAATAKHRKPQHVMYHVATGKIELAPLVAKLKQICINLS